MRLKQKAIHDNAPNAHPSHPTPDRPPHALTHHTQHVQLAQGASLQAGQAALEKHHQATTTRSTTSSPSFARIIAKTGDWESFALVHLRRTEEAFCAQGE